MRSAMRERIYLANALRMLDRVSERLSATPGQTIFCENDPACAAYLIVQGMVRLCGSKPGGTRVVTEFRLPNDAIGVLERGRYLRSAEAVTDVVLQRYPKAEVDHLVRASDTEEGNLLVHCVWEDSAETWRFLSTLSGQTANQRIASFLVHLLQRVSSSPGESMRLPADHDIADHIGITQSEVSRVFRELARDRAIALGPSGTCTILNPGMVVAMAAHAVVGKRTSSANSETRRGALSKAGDSP